MARAIFSIRMIVVTSDGTSHEQVATQFESSLLDREAFVGFSFGRLVSMVTTGFSDMLNLGEEKGRNGSKFASGSLPIESWSIEVIDPVDVLAEKGAEATAPNAGRLRSLSR